MTTTQLLLDSEMVIKSEFFNQSPICAFIWNNDKCWSVKNVSKNIINLLGYSKEEFSSGKVIYSNLIHPNDISKVQSEVNRHSLSRELDFKHTPYRIKHKNGNYIWVEDTTSIIYDNDQITNYVGYISDCTKEKESIIELENSRQMWIDAIEKNGDGLWEWNILTNEVYFSTQWKKMLGFKDDEISNHVSEWEKRVHPEDIKRVEEEIGNYLNGNTPQYVSEHRVLCKDGTYKWILDRGSITKYTEDGNAKILTGTHLDISEKKEIEKELEQSLSYNRVLIDNLPFFIWLKDKNNKYLKVNKAFANASKFKDPRLLIDKNVFDIWPKELARKYKKKDKEVLVSGKSIHLQENTMINGEEKWLETFRSPVYDKDNELLGSVGYSKDITERVKIEEKLKLKNKQIEIEKSKLASIIHVIPDLLWIKDVDGVYLTCNERFEKFFGAREEEIVGKTDYDFVSKDLADFFRNHDKNAMNSKNPVSNYEELVFADDGHREYCLTTKTKVISMDGEVYGVLGIARDITKLKQYQDEIIDQKEEFETVFNNSTDGIAILDLEARFLNCNDAYCEMLGYSKDELLTKTWVEITVPEDKEKSIGILQDVIETGFINNFEKRTLRKNKEVIYINMSASFLPDKKRLLLIVRNVSQLKLLEEQSKLVAMGEMIGNIAHQWRQPLSVISTASTGLKLQKEFNTLSDEQFNEACDGINEQAQYLSNTIEDFRNFIRNEKVLGTISIKETLEYTMHLTKAGMANNYIKICTNLEDDLSIHANKNELVQSFINILNNAKDALLEMDESKRYICIKTKYLDDNFELTISDSGGGISKDNIDRIFEPYFSTKHQSIGTGIGLSMVNKILRDKYNVNIDVYNETFECENKSLFGACFKMTFKKNT